MQCENPAAALGTTPAAALCSEAATGISNLAGAVSAGERVQTMDILGK